MERNAHGNRGEFLLFGAGIFLLSFLLYGTSLFHEFVFWDDPLLVLDQPIAHGLTWTNISRAFTTYDPDLYVPLTFLSFQLNYAIAGLQPFLYHLTNLLLHAGSTVLAGWIFLQLTKNRWMSLVIALFFLVHPINTEAVAWVSARKDVLSSFFFLASLASYVRYRSPGPDFAPHLCERCWASPGKPSPAYWMSILFFLFGLLSKISILPLPFILLLVDWHQKRSLKKSLPALLPFFGLSVIFGLVSLFGKTGGTHPLWVKVLLGMKAVLFSLWHIAWPLDFSVIYPVRDVVSPGHPGFLIPLLIVIGICMFTVQFKKRFPMVTFSWWWFSLLLAPSFLSVEKGRDLVPELYLTSDRYAYLAAMGIFFVVATLLEHLRKRDARLGWGATALLIIVLSGLAFRQSLVWSNTETLLRHALARNPESSVFHNNLGVYYDSLGRSDDAAREFALAVQTGGISDAWFNQGMTLSRQHRYAEAIAALTKAVTLRPDYALAHLNLGAFLLDAGEIQKSINHLLTAQSLDPENIVVYFNLGIALERGGNVHDARRAYERALQMDPANAFARDALVRLRSP